MSSAAAPWTGPALCLVRLLNLVARRPPFCTRRDARAATAHLTHSAAAAASPDCAALRRALPLPVDPPAVHQVQRNIVRELSPVIWL